MKRAALIAVAVSLLLPAGASAATVKIVTADSCAGDVACSKYAGGYPVPVVTYAGAPGEANRLAVVRAGDTVTISDAGAMIGAEAPCRLVDPHRAECPASAGAPGVSGFGVALGDGDDTLVVTGALGTPTVLDGGDGADALTGGADADTVDGGPGADRIEGGPGRDVLSFAGRKDPIVVDLTAGRSSDGDVLAGLEAVTGGDGDDRVLGGFVADFLFGGAGDDVLRGAGGADTLIGGLGSDRLDGGPGPDGLSGDPEQGDGYYTPRIEFSRDVLRGGAGDDTLDDPGGANTLVGGDGDDSLTGGEDADVLRGGAGADGLDGLGGEDVLSGEAGPDRLTADDGRRDRLLCGAGRDRARVDRRDRLRGCERVHPRRYTAPR